MGNRLKLNIKEGIVLLLFGVATLPFYAQNTYNRVYGNELYNEISSSARLLNGNAILIGDGDDVVDNYEVLLLRELDELGEVVTVDSIPAPCCQLITIGRSGSFEKLNSDGFIWAGTRQGGGEGILIKLTNEMDTVWTRSYQMINGYNVNVFSQIEQKANGNLIVAGTLWVSDEPNIFLMEVDPNGETLWISDDFDTSNAFQSVYDLSLTPDENIYVSGRRYGNGYSDPILVRYDSIGNMQWDAVLGNPDLFDSQMKVVALENEGALTCYLHTDSIEVEAIEESTYGDLHFHVFDEEGNVEEEFQRGETKIFGAVHDLDMDSEGNVLAVGEGYGGYGGFTFSWLLKLNSDYSISFERKYDFLECWFCFNKIQDVSIDNNNNYLLSGYVHLDTLQYDFLQQSWMVKTDCEGRLEPPPLDLQLDVLSVNDSTLSVAASGEYFHAYHWDFDDGTLAEGDSVFHVFDSTAVFNVHLTAYYCNIAVDTIIPFTATVTSGVGEYNFNSFNIYPNPTSSITTIELARPSNEILSAYDAQGREVFSEPLNSRQKTTLPSGEWAKGVYLIRVGEVVRSLVVE